MWPINTVKFSVIFSLPIVSLHTIWEDKVNIHETIIYTREGQSFENRLYCTASVIYITGGRGDQGREYESSCT